MTAQWTLLRPPGSAAVAPAHEAAMEAFEPPDLARDADRVMVEWLRGKAPTADRDVWLLTEGQTLVAYHDARTARCVLPNWQEVASIHADFAARHRDRPGAGELIVAHLFELALDADRRVATLDPFDKPGERPWERHGFLQSRTRAQEDPTWPVVRLYRPADLPASPSRPRRTRP